MNITVHVYSKREDFTLLVHVYMNIKTAYTCTMQTAQPVRIKLQREGRRQGGVLPTEGWDPHHGIHWVPSQHQHLYGDAQ